MPTLKKSLIQFTLLGLLLTIALGVNYLSAWTGPGSAPPAGNVGAPLNVTATNQAKQGWLGVGSVSTPIAPLDVTGSASVDSLAVFGSMTITADTKHSSLTAYDNFGPTSGSGGYGIRNNNGVMEFKNTAGMWSPIASTTNSVTSISALILKAGIMYVGDDPSPAKTTNFGQDWALVTFSGVDGSGGDDSGMAGNIYKVAGVPHASVGLGEKTLDDVTLTTVPQCLPANVPDSSRRLCLSLSASGDLLINIKMGARLYLPYVKYK